MRDAWERTITAAQIRPIRPYDLRHAFASPLIAAGKNPLYVARQLGHYSAGFTLDTYGHLMESMSRLQVEWIDELVFPEGWEVAVKLHLSGAPQGAAACSPGQLSEELKPSSDAGPGNLMQSGAPGRVAGPAGVEPAAYRLGGGRSIH